MYQTLKKVFEHIDKHLEVRSSGFLVFGNVEIMTLVSASIKKIYQTSRKSV